jgi:2-polyprenyl-3-methyl-5-hydroxy-6-metoxy-1,4-benzoquinol methylase
MSLLNYYLERGISPVHYLASNLGEHLERRQSLYDMLGLPGLVFRDKNVLEIAAGSGQNSLYVAAQRPSKYVIVEPNPVALKQIEETYRDFALPHTRPEVIPVTLESYAPDETFDVVICEGWLGSSTHERALVGTVADRVAPGGMMVLTALSICGWLSNLIRYCLVQKLLAGRTADYDAQVGIVLEALSPHLRTISGMTRRHEDWVKDNMVNPTYLDQGLTLEMVLEEAAPRGFTVFGASPDFITEWRWFKQLHGENIRTNENVLACYERWSHNFLDYRRTFGERDATLNRQLNGLSNDLLNALSESKSKAPDELGQDYFGGIAELLDGVAGNLDGVAGDLGAAVREAIQVLKASATTPATLAAMKNYASWFGRETLYYSLQRSAHVSA